MRRAALSLITFLFASTASADPLQRAIEAALARPTLTLSSLELARNDDNSDATSTAWDIQSSDLIGGLQLSYAVSAQPYGATDSTIILARLTDGLTPDTHTVDTFNGAPKITLTSARFAATFETHYILSDTVLTLFAEIEFRTDQDPQVENITRAWMNAAQTDLIAPLIAADQTPQGTD